MLCKRRFAVDGEEILRVAPGPGGFWELGGFDQRAAYDNPWKGASRMAPFDQEVSRRPAREDCFVGYTARDSSICCTLH